MDLEGTLQARWAYGGITLTYSKLLEPFWFLDWNHPIWAAVSDLLWVQKLSIILIESPVFLHWFNGSGLNLNATLQVNNKSHQYLMQQSCPFPTMIIIMLQDIYFNEWKWLTFREWPWLARTLRSWVSSSVFNENLCLSFSFTILMISSVVTWVKFFNLRISFTKTYPSEKKNVKRNKYIIYTFKYINLKRLKNGVNSSRYNNFVRLKFKYNRKN